MTDAVLCEIRKREAALIALRRELHKVPEIGGELPKTRKIVCDFLDNKKIPYILNPHDDGLVAEIKGAKEGRIIAFRADMDGLHIKEDTNLPYKSQIEGQMHGCGHDAHTAILLMAAEIINEQKDNLSGTVRLLFQSGEETGTGAKQMLKQGALNGVDAVCAIHVGNLAGDEQETGNIIVLPGPVSAGKNKFTITVLGKGGHSAFPDKAIDPIIVGAKIVERCRKMMLDEYKDAAAVLNFGSFNAGLDHNTIPERATLRGGIRVQDENFREELGKRLNKIAEDAARESGAKSIVELKKGSQTVMNDAELSRFVAKTLTEALGEQKVVTEKSLALMGSDDFANYASLVPSVYFFLHTNNNEKGIVEANHNPRFDIDESVLWEGVAAYTAIAMNYLK